MIESLQDLSDMASNERSIPTKHNNSIPVSVSNPSFGVNHSSVGLFQKFSSIDELTNEMFQLFSINRTLSGGLLFASVENFAIFLYCIRTGEDGGGRSFVKLKKLGHCISYLDLPHPTSLMEGNLCTGPSESFFQRG